MRADRLLRIVFRLQGRGIVSASTLAQELEVSTRTIRRDMEALSAAGIPVYSTRGGAGGWALVDDYRTSLTGLSTTEALAMIVGQPRGILADLGLDDPGDGLILKLLAAVAPAAREHAEHARQRIHVELGGYWGPVPGDPPPVLPRLLQAIWDDRVVKIRYGTAVGTVQVAPYGLVRKGAHWYLIGQRDDKLRTYRVSRMRDLTVTAVPFARPDEFDLVTFWRQSQDAYAKLLPTYPVRLRLRDHARIRAGWAFARTRSLSPPDADGWVEAEFDTEDWEGAVGLVRSLGGDVVVVEPDRLRRQVIADAHRLIELN
ncbi:WYL domain-containing protein [Actinopolymorpha sp. B17G11]|uniref:helix-turn-helix transcriptional regulator n=1 Tax=unclassified Actinopolymorpha TaxID=2627063 RepID=UPI0032D9604C